MFIIDNNPYLQGNEGLAVIKQRLEQLYRLCSIYMRDYSRSELNTAIDEWILNEKHRAILKRRLLDGICYEPLAEEFDMSVSQIKRIIYKSEEVLFRHL